MPFGAPKTGPSRSLRRRAWEVESKIERSTSALDSGRLPTFGGGRHTSARAEERHHNTWGSKMASSQPNYEHLDDNGPTTGRIQRSLSFDTGVRKTRKKAKSQIPTGLASATLPQAAIDAASDAEYTGEFSYAVAPGGDVEGQRAVVLTAQRPMQQPPPVPGATSTALVPAGATAIDLPGGGQLSCSPGADGSMSYTVSVRAQSPTPTPARRTSM